jgi:hypothetical protein
MQLAIVTFDLTHSPISYAELRDWVVDKSMDDYVALPGLRFKAWFSDELNRQWGAVYLVDDRRALSAGRIPTLPDGHTGPIGARPTSIRWFELEALVAGPDGLIDAFSAGLCLEHRATRSAAVWRMPAVS